MIKFIHREQLYKQVWSEPFTKLAPKHNISATELRKLCNMFSIPIPQMGHWQKIAFGKKIEIPSLPIYNRFSIPIPKMGHWQKIAFGHIIEIPLLSHYKSFTLQVKSSKEVISKAKIHKPIVTPTKKHKITVRNTLTSPHPIIARTRDRLKSRKPDEYGMIHSEDDCVDIRISPANYKKVLRVIRCIILKM